MPTLETPEATTTIEELCLQLGANAKERSALEDEQRRTKKLLDPIERQLKEAEAKRNVLKAKLKAEMTEAGEKHVKFHGVSAVIEVGRAVEIIDQDAAVAAITELGRLDEITKVTFNQTAIKRISDGQKESLPGVEVVETRTLRVTP